MSVETNIEARQAADSFFELAEEIVQSIPQDANVRFWQIVFERLKERFPEERKEETVKTPERIFDSDVEDAQAIVEEIIELAESEDLPERAQDFAESVSERAASIMETIEERGEATESQLTALENMRKGLQKWFR